MPVTTIAWHCILYCLLPLQHYDVVLLMLCLLISLCRSFVKTEPVRIISLQDEDSEDTGWAVCWMSTGGKNEELTAKKSCNDRSCYCCVVVVFTLNRSFYPTSAVPPVSFLILHPNGNANYVVTDSSVARQSKTQNANQVITYRVREHNTATNI